MMPTLNKVEVMRKPEQPKQADQVKRKPILSPELSEFLHMLKSLESELETHPAVR
jgi:hypothetical protein